MNANTLLPLPAPKSDSKQRVKRKCTKKIYKYILERGRKKAGNLSLPYKKEAENVCALFGAEDGVES